MAKHSINSRQMAVFVRRRFMWAWKLALRNPGKRWKSTSLYHCALALIEDIVVVLVEYAVILIVLIENSAIVLVMCPSCFIDNINIYRQATFALILLVEERIVSV
jgi:hypothetical protein